MNGKELIKALEHAAQNRRCELEELVIYVDLGGSMGFVPQQLLATTMLDDAGNSVHTAGLLPYPQLPDDIDPKQADLFDVNEEVDVVDRPADSNKVVH